VLSLRDIKTLWGVKTLWDINNDVRPFIKICENPYNLRHLRAKKQIA
jgi:hypothetical protein